VIREQVRKVPSGYLMLVVLCGEEAATPVVNTGTLYN
jgi:hypothetical protein